MTKMFPEFLDCDVTFGVNKEQRNLFLLVGVDGTLGVRNDHKTCHMAHQTRHMVTFGRYIFNNDLMVSL